MLKKENLFYLIHSLTKSEKRYFRLSCTSPAHSNYLRLFDAISQQEKYDEAALKLQFAGESFLKQLTATKYYLKKLILKSLRNFYATISKDAELKDLLRNTEILFHKGLFQLCKLELERAQKIAAEYENSTALYQVYGWQRRLLQVQSPRDYVVMKALNGLQNQCVEQLAKYQQKWGENLDPSTGTIIPLQTMPPTALQLYVLQGLLNYQKYLSSNRSGAALDSLYQLLDYVENLPKRMAEAPSLYINVLNNLVAYLVFDKKHEAALLLIQKAKAFIFDLKFKSAQMTKALMRTYNIELEIYRDQQNFVAATALMEEIIQLFQKTTIPIPLSYQFSFRFQFGYLFFLQKQFDGAIHWINEILNDKKSKSFKDIYTFAQWLNLMVHFELGNFFVLRYFVDGFRRYLKQRKDVQDYEKTLLAFFVKISKLPPFELKDAFRSLEQQLKSEAQSIPQSVLDYVDFYGWIEGGRTVKCKM